MLTALAPARRRFVLSAMSVAAVLLVCLGVWMLWRAVHGVTPVVQDELGPVLMVPGYGGSAGDLAQLAQAVEATGRDVLVLDPVGDGTGALEEQAGALAAAAARAIDNGAPSVDVVGYSAGGVVAREWVKNQGGDEAARRVVTIGSPHHGTDLVQFALEAAGTCPQACRQLAPGSDFLRGLNAGDETPDGPTFVSVWSETDQVVTPPDSARLVGALNLTVQQLCPGSTTSHGALPADEVTLEVVESALGVAPPAPPRDVDCT
jgi:triacylglycerol esterase/lipase EstA (alpha/beta hydrolase family)